VAEIRQAWAEQVLESAGNELDPELRAKLERHARAWHPNRVYEATPRSVINRRHVEAEQVLEAAGDELQVELRTRLERYVGARADRQA
jgi:hypothetical protein